MSRLCRSRVDLVGENIISSRLGDRQVEASQQFMSAGGVADEWVTQLLRQGDAQVFKKYSQMKLQMKREAQGQLKRQANETQDSIGTLIVN
jgi:hypothetical protein